MKINWLGPIFLCCTLLFSGTVAPAPVAEEDRAPPDLSDRAFDPGTTVLVVNHSDIEAAFERASQVEGVQVLSEPSETNYPSYDGTSTIRVMVSVLQDPDGITVEVNQLLDELHN